MLKGKCLVSYGQRDDLLTGGARRDAHGRRSVLCLGG
jgi:hypothetical protein